ncbi:MAG: Fe(2+)-trafficking protein [Myxococcaceae bacterium]
MTDKLESAPFPGQLGEEILTKVSPENWADWREMQTKIINEYRLDLSESTDRQTLLKQMRSFLKLDSQGAEVLSVGTPV